MGSLGRVKGAVIQHLDAAGRLITVSGPPTGASLTVRVDDGALIATKQHQLMKLEQFQIGTRVNLMYVQQPDGTLLAKSMILERGASVSARRTSPQPMASSPESASHPPVTR